MGAGLSPFCALGEPYLPVGHVEVAVGRDDVDAVPLDADGLVDLLDRHLRLRLEHLGQAALVLRREVQDDDEGQPGVGGHALEELPERLDAAGRSAYSDEHQVFSAVTGHSSTRARGADPPSYERAARGSSRPLLVRGFGSRLVYIAAGAGDGRFL
jgi:hypothetical protein